MINVEIAVCYVENVSNIFQSFSICYCNKDPQIRLFLPNYSCGCLVASSNIRKLLNSVSVTGNTSYLSFIDVDGEVLLEVLLLHHPRPRTPSVTAMNTTAFKITIEQQRLKKQSVTKP